MCFQRFCARSSLLQGRADVHIIVRALCSAGFVSSRRVWVRQKILEVSCNGCETSGRISAEQIKNCKQSTQSLRTYALVVVHDETGGRGAGGHTYHQSYRPDKGKRTENAPGQSGARWARRPGGVPWAANGRVITIVGASQTCTEFSCIAPNCNNCPVCAHMQI